jgi:hypothetical protein
MAAKKKRIRDLVEAVSAILGDQKKAKKLKKAKALQRFIVKLKDKHREMEEELALNSFQGNAAKEKSRQAAVLAKQIGKAEKILADMK